ncbi:SDR family oxidoreductase [Zavarzinia sp.]|uniref:SDR family oxidoreductase n=1 Tax=Zavarzinia sp. TaxID=2027920 RepID=UPI003564C3CA
MTESFRIASDEVTLSGRVTGKADGPSVVLIHGYPDDSTVWDGVVADLAADHRVITYDVRGAGVSTAPQGVRGYHLDRLMADLATVLDHAAPSGKVHLVGHDWGSIQGWQAVVDPRTRHRIASYTALGAPSLDIAFATLRERLKHDRLAAVPAALNQLMRSWYILAFQLPFLAPALWRGGVARLWPRILQRLEGIAAEARPGQMRDGINGVNLYRANFRERMIGPKPQTVDVPVQLLVATGDPFAAPATFDGLAKWVPNLTREEIAAGHWLPLTEPGLLAGRIRRFVARVEGGRDDGSFRHGRRLAAGRTAGAGPLAGRQALVTGAGSGIGRATAIALAERGVDVIATDIDLEAAERTATLVRLVGVEAVAQRCDVGRLAEMEALASWVDAERGPVDIVVNNAGIGLAGSFLDTSDADWRRLLEINVLGVIHGARLFGQRMAERKSGGHIVNVASAAAYMPARGLSAYAATKAAVLMMSTCLRAELAEAGIGVTAVCPGIIDTGITDRTRFVGVSEDEQARKRKAASRLYARRALTAETVAARIVASIEGNNPVARVGLEAVLGDALGRLSPALMRRLAKADLMPK